MKITSFKKKTMKLLTNEQQKPYQNAKVCYICKETFEDKHAKVKLRTTVLNSEIEKCCTYHMQLKV